MTLPSLRLLVLLRYGERYIQEHRAAVTAWAQYAWPQHAVTVLDSTTEFQSTRSVHGGRMNAWIAHVVRSIAADGSPSFHAFATLDPVVGHATGVIVQQGMSTGRTTYLLTWPEVEHAGTEGFTGCPWDFAQPCERFQTVTGVEPLTGVGRHDWRLVVG